MDVPRDRNDLQTLVEEEVQESIHLDYKASLALDKRRRDEIAKDVSAFANSDGGILIYGIREEGHLPEALDEGVPNDLLDREWLANVLDSNISPKIPGIEIVQIPAEGNNSFYVVAVPKSFSGPHQAPSKQYYKRYNFSSAPMEHYEVEDVRNRRQVTSRLVTVDVEVERNFLVYLVVRNPGTYPAEQVEFEFSPSLDWHDREGRPPHAFANGIRYLPPGRELRFFYQPAPKIFDERHQSVIAFSVAVTYYNRENELHQTEEFGFDFNDFLEASAEPVDREVERQLKEITRYLKKLADTLDKLARKK